MTKNQKIPKPTQTQSAKTEQPVAKPPKVFSTIDGNTLMAQQFEPLRFSVDKILPHGLFILAGSPKVGKSWLALDMCQAVATGSKLWDFSTEQGSVLYLALEDNHNRLQGRLSKFEADAIDVSRLHMTTTSFGIHDGLIEQAHNFVTANPDTGLIVIDTLEHVRNGGMDKTLYSYDYQDMCKLREITNTHNLTLLLVHHTRKMHDSDPLNTISGSTGLIGAVDGVFVLEKAKRTEHEGKLTIANRDTEGFCFDLKFDTETCRWAFIGNSTDGDGDADEDVLAIILDDFLENEWNGTSTELCSELKKMDGGLDINPAALGKKLRASVSFFKKEFGIIVDFDRSSAKKKIHLKRTAEQSE